MGYHPDKNPNDPSTKGTFQKINAAYLVLSDPDKRQAYDSRGETSSGGDHLDIDTLLKAAFQGVCKKAGHVLPLSSDELRTGTTRDVKSKGQTFKVKVAPNSVDGGSWETYSAVDDMMHEFTFMETK